MIDHDNLEEFRDPRAYDLEDNGYLPYKQGMIPHSSGNEGGVTQQNRHLYSLLGSVAVALLAQAI